MKQPNLHPYSDRASFDRLLLLIATLIQHPGIGSASDGDPVGAVQTAMQAIATELGIPLPWYANPTLRKDMGFLRQYRILHDHLYRHGYYLGTGIMTQDELRLAMNALASQAKYQGDACAKQTYQTLSQRIKGLDGSRQGELLYPVRSQFNRATTYTDPDEMMRKHKHRNTLFHQLATVEQAIIQGIPLELHPHRKSTCQHLYPLQLIYQDVAWYLLCEDWQDGHLMTYRMDRLTNYAKPLEATGRGLEAQRASLAVAHQLLENGWGLFLDDREPQRLERAGELPLQTVKVRFFDQAIPLILEGDRRHAKQKIIKGKLDPETGNLSHVDYVVKLPERSLQEFGWWLNRYLDHAIVLTPSSLRQTHRDRAMKLLQRYAESDRSISPPSQGRCNPVQ